MTDKQANRPILSIPRSPAATVLDIVAAAGTVLSVALPVQSWKALPPVIPVHFGLSGMPDGWGAKAILWLFPALSAAIYMGLTVLSRFPHTFNYPVPITSENAARQYRLAGELQELAEGGTDRPVCVGGVGDGPGGFGQGGGTGCGVCAVSIPFPKIRWPKILSSCPLVKSLSHSYGLLCTTGMLPSLPRPASISGKRIGRVSGPACGA
ncbi:DUF1648 domain-containing protein [Kamptonema formosum]|uniref:DUF1648 domain-containing protein n=1 Tax=Kamptonema formosum TaxID=331992 RepID=UPI0008FBCD59|nr:DUF1648 domain-containing protein [Oscillatoria sp. PCC 10802]